MKGFRIHLIADNGVVTMRLLVWAAVLTALVAGWAPAQTAAAVAVDGTVKDGAGLALAGAIVTLEPAAGAEQPRGHCLAACPAGCAGGAAGGEPGVLVSKLTVGAVEICGSLATVKFGFTWKPNILAVRFCGNERTVTL